MLATLPQYKTKRNQHSQECKDPHRQCFCDSWLWPLTFQTQNSLLWWLQRNGCRRVSHNDGTDLSRFWVDQKSRKVLGHVLGYTLQIDTIASWFVDATFRSGDMQCRVRKSRKLSKIWRFCAPNLGGEPSEFFGGTCNSTPLPTYWPSLVKIPWLVFLSMLTN